MRMVRTRGPGRQKRGQAGRVESRTDGRDGDKGRMPPGVENRNHRFIAHRRQELPASGQHAQGCVSECPPRTRSTARDGSLGQLLCHCFSHLVLQVGAFLPFGLELQPLVVRDLQGGCGDPGSACCSVPAPLASQVHRAAGLWRGRRPLPSVLRAPGALISGPQT